MITIMKLMVVDDDNDDGEGDDDCDMKVLTLPRL